MKTMENSQSVIASKLNELSAYGYVNHFNFNNDLLELIKTKDDEIIETKNYVLEQVSIEAEYVYEDKGTAVVTLMTNDGELGYVIDHSDDNGQFPALNYFDSLED